MNNQVHAQALSVKAHVRTGAFDFGTSPHGLPADLPPSNQETLGASNSFFLAKQAFALGFFVGYCRLIGFLCRVGLPAWLINSTRLFVPDALMFAGARLYLRRVDIQAGRRS